MLQSSVGEVRVGRGGGAHRSVNVLDQLYHFG